MAGLNENHWTHPAVLEQLGPLEAANIRRFR